MKRRDVQLKVLISKDMRRRLRLMANAEEVNASVVVRRLIQYKWKLFNAERRRVSGGDRLFSGGLP